MTMTVSTSAQASSQDAVQASSQGSVQASVQDAVQQRAPLSSEPHPEGNGWVTPPADWVPPVGSPSKTNTVEGDGWVTPPADWVPPEKSSVNKERLRFYTQHINMTPDEAKNIFALSRETEIPESFFLRVLKSAKEVADFAEQRDIDAFALDSGLTAEWMAQSPLHTALLKDDLPNAVGLSTLVQRLNARAPMNDVGYKAMLEAPSLAELHTVPSNEQAEPASSKGLYGGHNAQLVQDNGTFGERTGRAFREGASQIRESYTGFTKILVDALGADNPVANIAKQVVAGQFYGSQPMAAVWQGAGEKLGHEVKAMQRERKALTLPEGTGAQKVWEDFVRSSPQMASQIVVGVVAGPLFGAANMGAQISGGQYAQLTSEGVKPGRAALASLANAGLQMPLEALQLSKLTSIFKASGLGQIVKSVGEAAVTSFVTETLQNYPDAATTLWAEADLRGRTLAETTGYFFDNLGEITLQGMYEGALSVPWSLIGGSGKIAHDLGRYRTLQQDKALFGALDESAKTSKLRGRLPEAYQDMLTSITANGPVSTIYMDAADLKERVGGDAFYSLGEKLGLNKADLDRTVDLGAEVEVPLAVYQTHIAGTDISLQVRDIVRFEPGAMTLAEQEAFTKVFPTHVQDLLQQASANAIENAALDAALAPVQAELESVYGKGAVSANMGVMKARAHMAATMWSEATGKTVSPAQVVTEKWGLRVEAVEEGKGEGGGEGTGGEVLNQAMYRNRADTVRSFVSDVLESLPNSPKSFYHLGSVTREDGTMSGVTIELASDQVRHIHARHPDFVGWDDITRTIANGNKHKGKADPVTGNMSSIFIENHGEISNVVMGSMAAGKKGERFVVGTAFTGKSNEILTWIKEKKDAAFYQSAAGSPAYPRSMTDPSELKSSVSGKTITTPQEQVKGTPTARGHIVFSDTAAVVRLFKGGADLSTFMHEAGHLFVRDLENLLATGNAPQSVVNDMAVLQAFTADMAERDTLHAFYEKEFAPARSDFADLTFEQLTAAQRDRVLATAQQEKLANAFVSYLKEGHAPSVELQTAFGHFKNWLKSLYQWAMGDVVLNDDVRAVFDKMLASDADIELVNELHEINTKAMQAVDAVAAKMLTKAEQARLEKIRQQATEQSKAARLKKSLKAYFESLIGKKELKAEAQKLVNRKPVYVTMDLAISEGGLNRESVVAAFGEDTAKALNKKRVGLVRNEGSVQVHDLAVLQGYDSVETMIVDMLDAPGKSKEMKEAMRQAMQGKEALLREALGLDDGAIPGDVDFYNDTRLEALMLEAKALERKAHPKKKATGNAELNRQWAQRILQALPWREALSVAKYAAAEAKEAGKSARALAKGNIEESANAKTRQVINHAMVLESLKMRSKQQRFERALKRWATSKIMVFAYQEQILGIAQRYSLGPKNRYAPRKPEERLPLGEFIQKVTEDEVFGMPPFDDFVLSETVPEVMTMGQREEVQFVAKWLATEGSPGEAELITQGVTGSVQDAAKSGAALIHASGNVAPVYEEGTVTRSAVDKWRGIFAKLNEAKDQWMKADGYAEIGSKGSHKKGFHSLWYQRIMDATNEMSRLYRTKIMPEQKRIEFIRDGFIQRFEKKYGKRAPEINGIKPPANMQEIGRMSWTAEHVWCLARNMGNAGNLKTLHVGFGLDMNQLQALTSILNAEEWQAVQGEGDLLGAYYEQTDEVFRRIYGRPMPDKVQPQALTVRTAEGIELNMHGWYFPISIDTKLSPDIKDKTEIDALHGDPNFTAFGPSLAHGHTKGRTGTGKPPGLYFGVFERAMSDQLRFMTHAPVIRDFDRITRNNTWRKAYIQAFGQQAYDEIRPWLKFLARPINGTPGSLDGFLNRQRQLATLFILGHNVKTFLRQFQGFFQSAPELGASWEFKGLARVMLNPLAAAQAIRKLSPFMADRAKGWDRDQREALNSYKAVIKLRINGKTYTENDVHQFTMGLIQVGDLLTTNAIWQGAYMKAQQHLDMNQKEAVAFADSIIQKTQASATVADLTPIQREGGVWRVFTMFMGESLRKGSRMRYWWGALQAKKITMREYAHHLAMETVVPSLYYVWLVGLLSGGDPDKEDLAIAVWGEAAGTLPFITGLSGALQYNKPLMQSPVFTGVESAMKLVERSIKVGKDPNNPEAWSGFYKSLVDLFAYGSGIGNVRRLYSTAAEGWEDLNLGQTHNPFRLFFKRPKE